MVNYTWTGATDTSSINVTNWSPNGLPGPNDVVIFDSNGTRDCSWQHPATSPTITVDEMIIESDFAHDLTLNAIPVIKGMSLNKNIIDGTGTEIEFRSGPISSGGYKTYNNKYLLIGDSATYSNGRENLTFDFYATNTCAFDDGQHPNIRLASGDFTPKYTTPTGTSGVVDFYTLTINSGVSSFAPDVSIVANDKNKHFKMASGTTSQFGCSIAVVNWGSSTVEFTGVSSGTFNLPVSLTTNYNSGTFEAYYRKIILSANSTGDRIDMQDNRYLSVEEFEIGDGLLFVGPRTLNAQGSDVRTILPPKIRGSWSFSSISDGIYRSPRQASGPMPKIDGNFHITGKLDVDGLIDPTGLELNPQASNPGGVAANTLWLNSGDSNKLYQGSSAVGGTDPQTALNTTEITNIKTKSHMWVTKSSTQSYTPAATPAVIQYDTVQYDTGSDWDSANYAFEAPRTGYYLVDVGFYLATTPTWSFSMVYKSTDGGSSWNYIMRNVSGSGQQNKLVNVVKLNAGDLIAHYANSSNTGTINVSVTSLTYFRVAELIG